MANSLIRVPIPSGASINAALISHYERAKSGAFDVDAIFATLRESLSSGTQEVGSFAASIAEAAQFLTGATGAAVGLRYGEGMFCLGRSGETAPAVGAELTLKSGFSAECVRTGKSLRCDDARDDYRTDAAVCRRLGVFSVAAVPIRGEKGCVGLLEVFSNRTFAFSEKHMVFLERLAELASIAQERDSNKQIPGVRTGTASGDPRRAARALAGRIRTVWELARPRNWALGAGVLALIVSVVRLEPWRTPSTPAHRAHTAEQKPAMEPETVVIDAVIPKPSPVHGAVTAAVLKNLGEPKRAEVQKLYHSDTLTILNVIWAPWMNLLPHNHQMWAIIGLYTGREDNIFWRRVPGSPDRQRRPGAGRRMALHHIVAGDTVDPSNAHFGERDRHALHGVAAHCCR